jgi:predicted NUDIX family NTP pyrophosphohydrolase
MVAQTLLCDDYYKRARAEANAKEARVRQRNEIVEDLGGLAQQEQGPLTDVANERMEDMKTCIAHHVNKDLYITQVKAPLQTFRHYYMLLEHCYMMEPISQCCKH